MTSVTGVFSGVFMFNDVSETPLLLLPLRHSTAADTAAEGTSHR